MPRLSRTGWIAQADRLTQSAETAASRYAAAAVRLKEMLAKRENTQKRLQAATQFARLKKAKLESTRQLLGKLASLGPKDCLSFGCVSYSSDDISGKRQAENEEAGAYGTAQRGLRDACLRHTQACADTKAAQVDVRRNGRGVDIAFQAIEEFREVIRVGVTEGSPDCFHTAAQGGHRNKDAADFVDEIGRDHREFFSALEHHLGVAAARLIDKIQGLGETLGRDRHKPRTQFPQVPAAESVEASPSKKPILPDRQHGLAVPFAKTLATLPLRQSPVSVSPMHRPVGHSLFGRQENDGERPARVPNPLSTELR